jgi:glycerol kinase
VGQGERADCTERVSERDARYTKWKMAVQRSLGWAVPKKTLTMTDERYRLLASIPGSLYIIGSFGLLALSEYLSAAGRTA